MKILEFKTVSPLFEMERDGVKSLTVRQVDPKDSRHRALSQWKPDKVWGIRIKNPTSQEAFTRRIIGVSYLGYHEDYHTEWLYGWRIIRMGELIEA